MKDQQVENSRKPVYRNEDLWMLKRQLLAHVANVTKSAAANLINGGLTVAVFSDMLSLTELSGGFAVLLALVIWRFNLAQQVITTGAEEQQYLSLARKITANATLMGMLWGTVTGYMLYAGGSEHQLFAGIIGAGMVSSGAITYRTLPSAATIYMVVVSIGSLVGLLSLGQGPANAAAGLLFCFIFVLVSNVRENAHRFRISNNRERALAKSSDTIQLLLNDYTEQGSDWLIELGPGERIVNPSIRFASAASRQVETLENKRLVSLFDEGPDRNLLEEHLVQKRAFRRHVVSLTVNGERRWWMVSARPIAEDTIVFRAVVNDITEQRRAEERVNYMAHYDGLTNLPNRFLFNDTVYRSLSADKGVGGLLYLDLDNFKAINDTLGHSVGDQLLQGVARRLEESVTGSETVARLSGDEFAILVPASRLDKISDIADSIIKFLGKPFSLNDHDVVVGVSIGMAQAPDHADDVEHLIRNADLALYSAKSSGRNRAVMFEAGMDEAAQMRRMIELDLRSALGKGEMRLHYQPLINVESGDTTGYEALIRWEHPTRGIVMPTTFIPVAEDTGMIVQIGEWVIRQALHDLSAWEPHISVSVNLSPVQMRSTTLISTIVSALAHSGVAAERLCIEITENVLMQDSDANIETLHKIRSLGVQIALDDFGTGYSSLNYLRSFPFSKIKIDRCFISEIDSREDCQAIVRSVVGLANSLGMTTTAEGVERSEQFDSLRKEGCSEVQGFLYSQAVPIEELTNLRLPKTTEQARLVQMEEARRAAEANTVKIGDGVWNELGRKSA
jgi:diguanylate cyclase (GGDEF)-like protein